MYIPAVKGASWPLFVWLLFGLLPILASLLTRRPDVVGRVLTGTCMAIAEPSRLAGLNFRPCQTFLKEPQMSVWSRLRALLPESRSASTSDRQLSWLQSSFAAVIILLLATVVTSFATLAWLWLRVFYYRWRTSSARGDLLNTRLTPSLQRSLSSFDCRCSIGACPDVLGAATTPQRQRVGPLPQP